MAFRLIRKIRYRLSRNFRIRVGVGIDVLRTKHERDSLIAFCRNELKDKQCMKLNPERKRIYEMTVRLYEQGLSHDYKVYAKIHKFKQTPVASYYNDLDAFVEDHVGWYWN